MLKTFPIGGIHPSDSKISRDCPIETMPLPETVTIPLSQHIGAPAEAVVTKGERVRTGQLIGRSTGFVSSNIHSSVTGTVMAVDSYLDPAGLRRPGVTIKTEPDEWMEGIDTSDRIIRECTLSPQEIVAKVGAAGVVGMGGATFPTQVKLSVPDGRKAEFLIINGVECEPYLTSDHRTMLEKGEELMVGTTILMRALGVKQAQIGIENNKPDAIAFLRELSKHYEGVRVTPLKVRYPQGGEKQLIAAVTGRQVPPPPGLPIDVGAVVCNASTTVAVYEAVQKRKPLVERIVTVTGKGMKTPSNYLVRMGTPIASLVEAAGGLPEGDVKVLNGGPMMGRAMVDLSSPVTKGCSGITVLGGAEAQRGAESACIKCAKCVQACPMGLEPYLLSKLSRKQLWERLEGEEVTSCIECGCCQFTCPADLPLLDYIRLGKQRVMGLIRARAVANAPKK